MGKVEVKKEEQVKQPMAPTVPSPAGQVAQATSFEQMLQVPLHRAEVEQQEMQEELPNEPEIVKVKLAR